MISIDEAQHKVISHSSALKSKKINVTESLNFVLANDIIAPIDLPPFNQSAMDGYAINGIHSSYKVVGMVRAGDSAENIKVQDNEAVRIFTGAMVPDGTSQVVMQEKVNQVNTEEIKIKDLKLSPNKNIRKKGEELQRGDIAIKKGTTLNSAAIGLISTLGINEIDVIEKPKVKIIETGSELTQAGNALEPGKIYGSNGIMIQSLLEANKFESEKETVVDNFNATKTAISEAIKSSNVVIITGGISVGEFDFVERALDENQVKKLFYKINQKPGKPMYYGKKENVHVFALPGNPAAAISCFFMYVLPGLKALAGYKKPINSIKKAVLASDYTKNGNRTYLLKGLYKNGAVEILNGQSSAMLSAFIDANCLIKLNGDKTDYKKGDIVECHPIF